MIDIKKLNLILLNNNLKELQLNFEKELELKNNEIINIFKKVNKMGFYPLLFILMYNKTQKLGFNNYDIINIINKKPEQLLEINQNKK